jgi:hypothetical protein
MRYENAAHVQWDRDRGVVVEPTGKRVVFPAFKEAEGDGDMDDISPIPYFPGRETLWFPSSDFGVAKSDVDDRAFVHPLANGAEAYYRYATGDSMSVRLPDGKTITLRELRITPRRPDWHLFVGSFWFDVAGGQLVRAAYRMSVDMDIWQVASEETKRDLQEAIERAQKDSGSAAKRAIDNARREAKDDDAPGWVKGMLSPMKATISAITVEYGLHEGRFWLPRRNVAEGEAQAGFLRVPLTVEESFTYISVRAAAPRAIAAAPPVPNEPPKPPLGELRTIVDSALALAPPADSGGAVGSITINIGDTPKSQTKVSEKNGQSEQITVNARIDSTLRRLLARADSQSHRADSLKLAGDTARARTARAISLGARRRAAALARRQVQCATDSVYDGGQRRRFNGALTIALRLPCDTSRLASSPDLPKSPYDTGDELFSSADRDALMNALDLSLQPAWGPQPPQLHSGLDLTRYNRIEGLSVGLSATSQLGAGYSAQALARIGTADWVPNAELSLARSDGRRTIQLGVFHRLGVANDDWGSPLSFGASLANLLYARDEGFFYRTFGAELTGNRLAPLFGASATWRLFAERQRSAGVEPNTQLSLGKAWGNARFTDNIAGQNATLAGAAGELARSFGQDPTALRLIARLRGEAAAVNGSPLASGTTGYGRVMTEGTLSRGFGSFAAAITGSAGAIAGEAPTQRLFYMGGLQTVRGQFARAIGQGYVGDAFWLARAELGRNWVSFRPTIFFDAGWAGARADWQHPGRPLTGAGVGASFMDGLVRMDLARGISPEKRTRFDVYLEARF